MTTLRNFGEDLAFLQQHTDPVLLTHSEQQKVVVVPEWQGRIMTSTTRGDQGFSYGWVNYDRIASGKIEPQINLFGGEDRFWVSPEGSQFSFFFDPGATMDLANWRTPAALDTEAFDLVDSDGTHAIFEKKMRLTNYAGNVFDLEVERTVQINDDRQTERHLGMSLPKGVFAVCHESRNQVTNNGDRVWTPQGGLPAVWILCMNKPSPAATVVVPFQAGTPAEKGHIVTADYFGALDASRLHVCQEDSLIYFRGDGRLRSKLGVSFSRVRPCLGAWDAAHRALTITQFNLPADPGVGYTNNLWKEVENPYDGDVINSYNDGPNESGGIMGPFYELETLSPALPLAPGESYTHIHRTFHLEGERRGLDEISRHVFTAGLDGIESQFESRPN